MIAIADWSRSKGFFGDIEKEFTEADLEIDNSFTYPSKDGRVEATFSTNTEPDIKFGLWSVDFCTN